MELVKAQERLIEIVSSVKPGSVVAGPQGGHPPHPIGEGEIAQDTYVPAGGRTVESGLRKTVSHVEYAVIAFQQFQVDRLEVEAEVADQVGVETGVADSLSNLPEFIGAPARFAVVDAGVGGYDRVGIFPGL